MLAEEVRNRLYGFNLGDLTLRSLERLQSFPIEELKSRVVVHGGLKRSGTTIVAFRYSGGVLVAGDKRVTSLPNDEFGAFTKVEYMEPLSLIGMAGTVAYIQELKNLFQKVLKGFSRMVGKSIYIDGQAEIMAHILRANHKRLGLLQYILSYVAHPVLAGWDPEFNEGKVFSFDEAGGVFEAEMPGYITIGSGGELARVVLDDRWQENMEEIDAVNLAVRAIMRASRDLWTSPSQLYPPTVLTVSSSGLRCVDEEDALSVVWQIYSEDIRRREDVSRYSFLAEREGEQ